LAAQVNREKGVKRKAMRLESLRESGDIEQDASLVLGLSIDPPESSKINKNQTSKTSDDRETMTIKVLKNRIGKAGNQVNFL
jgi:replicative DNA helicase